MPIKLTTRELQIVCLIRDGLADKEIAARLQVSEETVKRHNQNARHKLGCDNRVQMVMHCLRQGLIGLWEKEKPRG